jgi:hypothetical protein
MTFSGLPELCRRLARARLRVHDRNPAYSRSSPEQPPYWCQALGLRPTARRGRSDVAEGVSLARISLHHLHKTGLEIVYLYFQFPLMVLIIAPALAGLRREWREASEILGASALQYWPCGP